MGASKPRQKRKVVAIAWGAVAGTEVDVAVALHERHQLTREHVWNGQLWVSLRVPHRADGKFGPSWC